MEEDKIKNIKTLLELNGGTQSDAKAAVTIVNAIKHLVPDFKEENVTNKELENMVFEIQQQIIPIYDKYFSNEEILGIIEFYKSQIGQSYLNKMSKVIMECAQVGNKYGEIIYEKLMKLSNKND
jgi:hypothetical protein